MLRAYVFSICEPVRRAEAREDFQYCVDHKYDYAEGMRNWFAMEGNSNSSPNQERICKYVIDGKSYAEKVRQKFNSRKSTVLFFRGRDQGAATVDGFNLFGNSLTFMSEKGEACSALFLTL